MFIMLQTSRINIEKKRKRACDRQCTADICRLTESISLLFIVDFLIAVESSAAVCQTIMCSVSIRTPVIPVVSGAGGQLLPFVILEIIRPFPVNFSEFQHDVYLFLINGKSGGKQEGNIEINVVSDNNVGGIKK